MENSSSKNPRITFLAAFAILTVLVFLLSLIVIPSIVSAAAAQTQTCDQNPNQDACLKPCPDGYNKYGNLYCLPTGGLLDIFGNAARIAWQQGGAIASIAGEKVMGLFSVNTLYAVMSATGISRETYNNACGISNNPSSGSKWNFVTFTPNQALIVVAFLAIVFWLMFLQPQGQVDPKEELEPNTLLKEISRKKKAAWAFIQGASFADNVARLLYPGLSKGLVKNISRKGIRKERFRAAWDAVDGKVMGAVAAGADEGTSGAMFGQIDQELKAGTSANRQALAQNLAGDASMGYAGIATGTLHVAEYAGKQHAMNNKAADAKDGVVDSMGPAFRLAIVEGAALDAIDAVMGATHALAIGALFLILYLLLQWFPNECFTLNYKFLASLVWAYWMWEIFRVIITRSSFMLAMWIPRGLLRIVFIPFTGAGFKWLGRIFQILGMMWLMGRFHPAQYATLDLWIGLCWAMFLHVLILITSIGIAAILVQGTRPILFLVKLFVKILSKIFGFFTAMVYGNQSNQTAKMKKKFDKIQAGLEKGEKKVKAAAKSAGKTGARIYRGWKELRTPGPNQGPVKTDASLERSGGPMRTSSTLGNINTAEKVGGMAESAGSATAGAGEKFEQLQFPGMESKPKPPKTY